MPAQYVRWRHCATCPASVVASACGQGWCPCQPAATGWYGHCRPWPGAARLPAQARAWWRRGPARVHRGRLPVLRQCQPGRRCRYPPVGYARSVATRCGTGCRGCRCDRLSKAPPTPASIRDRPALPRPCVHSSPPRLRAGDSARPLPSCHWRFHGRPIARPSPRSGAAPADQGQRDSRQSAGDSRAGRSFRGRAQALPRARRCGPVSCMRRCRTRTGSHPHATTGPCPHAAPHARKR